MEPSELPADWDQRRQEVFERDDFVCMNCERKGGERGRATLRAYHLVPPESGGTHEISNLLTLCGRCKTLLSKPFAQASKADDYEARCQTIDDLADFDRAIEIVDKLESVVSRYGAQILGNGEKGAGSLVRTRNAVRRDARDVKGHIMTCKVLFANLNLPVMSREMQQAHTQLAAELFSLLRYKLAIVSQYQQYVEILAKTKCPRCGHYAEADATFCGECSRELPVIWECLQCHSNIDRLDEDYCSECHNELPELPPEQQADLDEIRETTATVVEQWQAQLQEVLSVAVNDFGPAHEETRQRRSTS